MAANLKTVLLVEDDVSTLGMMRDFLEKNLPVLVDCCTTVAGACEFLNRHCYDLILTDLRLQIDMGTTLVRTVLERDPTQPVAVTSEYERDMVKEELRELSE